MFTDRIDAGIQLSEKLNSYAGENTVVLAIPRGGLPVASVVAKSLNAPLDVALIKKLGHPHNREYAIGAVSMNNVVLSDSLGISQAYIKEETERIRGLLKKRYDQYYKNRSPKDLQDKSVIVIDDGIATGNTLMATIELVRKQDPGKVIVAVPVAPMTSLYKFKDSPLVDEVVCLSTPLNFHAVGQFYERFTQVSDEEAIAILESSNDATP